METKYKEIINSKLNSFSKELSEIKKKQLIFAGSMVGSGILFIALACAIKDGSSLFMFLTFIEVIVFGVLLSKLKNRKKKAIWDAQNDFYDEVYAGMIAEEIGGTHESSFFKKTKKEIEQYLGEIIEKKEESYNGILDGKAYSIEFAKGTVISQTTTKDGQVVSYRTQDLFTGTDFSVRCNRKADSDILLTTGLNKEDKADKGSKKRIKMDDKRFPFEVYCNDDIAAYKFLTPGIMSELQNFASSRSINSIEVNGEQFKVDMNDAIINMDPGIKFTTNVEKLKQRYTYEYIYSLAHPQAENFRQLLYSTLTVVR